MKKRQTRFHNKTQNRTLKKIKIWLYKLLYKITGKCFGVIVPKDYYENKIYVITEPWCCICGMHTKRYDIHSPYRGK
jgi:hypothetical protein